MEEENEAPPSHSVDMRETHHTQFSALRLKAQAAPKQQL